MVLAQELQGMCDGDSMDKQVCAQRQVHPGSNLHSSFHQRYGFGQVINFPEIVSTSEHGRNKSFSWGFKWLKILDFMNIWGETLDCYADTKWASSPGNHYCLSVTEHAESKDQVRDKLKAQGSEATFVQSCKHIAQYNGKTQAIRCQALVISQISQSTLLPWKEISERERGKKKKQNFFSHPSENSERSKILILWAETEKQEKLYCCLPYIWLSGLEWGLDYIIRYIF